MYHVLYRLFPWCVLSIVALGAACGPLGGGSDGSFPSLQIAFTFPGERPLDLAQLDLVVTVTNPDGSVQNQGRDSLAVSAGSLTDDAIWFKLLPHTRGQVGVSLAARLAGNPCAADVAQTGEPVNVQADQVYPLMMALTQQQDCLLTVAVDDAAVGDVTNPQRGRVDVYTDDGMGGPMRPSGSCGLACSYELKTSARVLARAIHGSSSELSTWLLDQGPQPLDADIQLTMATAHDIHASFAATSCQPGSFCSVKLPSGLGNHTFTSIWGRPLLTGQELWAVGSNGSNGGLVLYQDGSRWQVAACASTGASKCSLGSGGELQAVAGDPSQQAAWVVGGRNAAAAGVYYCAVSGDGSPSCADVNVTGLPTGVLLKGVSVASGAVWVATNVSGQVYRGVPNYQTSPISIAFSGPQTGTTNNDLLQLWAASDTEAFAAGDAGMIRHCHSPSAAAPFVCDDVFVTGAAYAAVTGVAGSPPSIWVGGGGILDRYIAGSQPPGRTVMSGGRSFTALAADSLAGSQGVWAAVDSGPSLLVYWSEAAGKLTNPPVAAGTMPPADSYTGVWTCDTDVWMVGRNGSIAHYRRS
jgi:hypothetical protein